MLDRTKLPPAPPPPRPMFWLALAWVAGLAGGINFPAPGWLTLGAALGLMALAAGWLLRARRIRGGSTPPEGLLLLALGLLAWRAGSGLAYENDAAVAQAELLPAGGVEARVTGTLAEEPTLGEFGWRLILDNVQIEPDQTAKIDRSGKGLKPLRLRQRLALALRGDAAEALGGARALPLPGQPVRAAGMVYPLLQPTTPSPFDSAAYYRSARLQARLAVERVGDMQLGPVPDGWWAGFLGAMRAAREGIGGLFERELPHPQANLARAFFLGEAERLELADRDAFRATGLSHLMAVSGFNVALVLVVIMVLARAGGAPPRWAAGIGIAAIILFTALTGFEAPVLRAALMGVFVLLGVVIGRPGNGLAGLALAVFISLVLDPRDVTRVDWQLSYACVLALLLFTRPLLLLMRAGDAEDGTERAPRTFWRRQWQTYVMLPLATTLAVQLGLFPLQIYYFRQLNVLFPLANLVGITLGAVAMIFLTVLILAGAIPVLVTAAAWGASISLELLMEFINWLQGMRWAQLPMPPLPLVWMLVFMAILLSGAWLRAGNGADVPQRQRRSFVVTLATLAVLIAWLPLWSAAHGVGTFDVYVLDVGQGDGIVVRAPNGHIMVVDAGRNNPDEGRRVVGPFLQTLGVRRIDMLVATHADADHIGGMPWLLEHFNVGEVVSGSDVSQSEIFRQTRALEFAHHVPIEQVERGAKLDGFGELEVRCLGSMAGLNDNNASVVLLLSEGATQVLLTGDMAQAEEDALLEAGALRDVEVLKVGHHGSKSSSSPEFLAAVRPELALISVGAHNRYGHPSPDVEQRLREVHAAAYRTDEQGTLWLHGDGGHVTLYRFAGQ